jgi:hypothetical protein
MDGASETWPRNPVISWLQAEQLEHARKAGYRDEIAARYAFETEAFREMTIRVQRKSRRC